MMRILLLGGTAEASRLAKAMADGGHDAVFSYAGRTVSPISQPLPTRIGGFGGIAGLVRYLQSEGITHVVDATHPFAAQMSGNAIAACAQTGAALAAFERRPWAVDKDDNWIRVSDVAGAVEVLPQDPARVFLAIGKQNLEAFSSRPEHFYLLRLVDAPQSVVPLSQSTVVLARGPFDVAGDYALMRAHEITHVVAKNAGGTGAEAKLHAARRLGLPVIMIDRPIVADRLTLRSVSDVLHWLAHGVGPVSSEGTDRGV